MRKLLFLIATTFLFASTAHSRGLLVSPAQLGLRGPAGSTATGTIQVSSSKVEKNQIRVLFSDYTRSEEGGVTLLDKTHDRSAKSWLEVDQSTFETPAEGRVEIQVTARIPKDAHGSYWAIANLSAMPPPRNGPGGMQFAIIPTVAVPVIVTVEGTEEFNVAVTEFEAIRASGDAIVCSMLLQNKGNAAVMITGALTLERRDGEEVASNDLSPLTSLPGTRMRVHAKIPWNGAVSGLQASTYLRFGPRPEDVAEASAGVREEMKTHAASAASQP